ncbi:hypothetical protein BOX37_17340 [Nocardia mangyaensis]|uniref:Uncharacterized protein n=1 Tax=Nocardia mangyaensis TaxID=2213200 RepID=A0A1J0VTP1_9NOCA|nr:hypothetical protein [Nocardia mangyaensis]APE35419.1 hypothetical protein BOX37_17340 [Nocardia mangyaensis]
MSIHDSTRAHAHVTVFWHAYAAHRDVFAAIEQATLANPAFAERMRAFRAEQMQPWIEWLTDLATRGARLPAETMIQSWHGDPDVGIDNLTDFVAAGLGP